MRPRPAGWKSALQRSDWCERGDSNPHGCEPLAPETSASTSSATFAASRVGSRFSATVAGMSIASSIFLMVMYSEVANSKQEPPMSATDGAALRAVPTPQEKLKNEIWNLPNSLTLLRIFLVPLLVVVLLTK